MKTLKTLMILFIFSNLLTSCSVEEIPDDSAFNHSNLKHLAGGEDEEIDETSKT